MLIPSQKAFVAYAKKIFRDGIVQEALDWHSAKAWPGCSPFRTAQQDAISAWFQALPDKDKTMVRAVLSDCTDRMVHGLLDILDNGLGDDTNYGRLELYSVCGEKRMHINPPGSQLCELLYRMIEGESGSADGANPNGRNGESDD